MKIVFIGMSAEYSLKHLEALEEKFDVVAIICAAPRNYQGSDDSFSQKNILYKNAIKRKIPFYFSKNISSEKFEKIIKNTECDLICIASCSQLIRKNIIEIPKVGVINAHPSKLPYYKGPNPDYWIFYYQEKEGGVTIHYVDEGEDTGDIILQETFVIPLGMTKKEYRKEILSRSPKLMQKAILELESGIAKRMKQPKITSFRARNLKQEDRVIDFKTWSAKRTYHFLRGTDMLDEQYKKTIWKISIEGYTENDEKDFPKKNGIICISGEVFYKKNFSLKRMAKIILRKN